MAAGSSTILFLRDNTDPDTPLITLEVRDQSIKQCYGFRDSYNRNPSIRDFLREYAMARDLKIDAVIYSD